MKGTVLFIVAAAVWPAFCQAQGVVAGSLPAPMVTKNSVETCLNSRYSQHALSKTPVTAQQIGNILWAARRAPVTGTYRNIYAATASGTYLYDPAGHALSRYSDEVASDGGLALIYDAQRQFDAGVMFMPALLAGVSLVRSTEAPVASCPKGIGYPRVRLFFGVQGTSGLTTQLAAHCSVTQGQPGWLPDPATIADNSLEEVLANLKYVASFAETNLTLSRISQILWAGYGCTAHVTSNGRAGLTVPSAYASYYLSRSIYLVNEDGVRHYQNRDPSAGASTRDHRLEPEKANFRTDSSEQGSAGRTVVPAGPSAPNKADFPSAGRKRPGPTRSSAAVPLGQSVRNKANLPGAARAVSRASTLWHKSYDGFDLRRAPEGQRRFPGPGGCEGSGVRTVCRPRAVIVPAVVFPTCGSIARL